MKLLSLITNQRVTRFLLVGAANTIINFVVLNFVFYELHLDKIISSILATSCAILFSFTFNRSFVFRDKTRPLGKFVRFTIVSAGGALLIQTSTYAIFVAALQHAFSSDFIVINLSNLFASFVVMFWNYHGYRLLVFKDKPQRDSTIEEAA